MASRTGPKRTHDKGAPVSGDNFFARRNFSTHCG
jgi:hypothetical protein